MSTSVMIIYSFHIMHKFKVMHFEFFILFYFTVLTKEIFFPFPSREYILLECKRNVNAGKSTLMSICDGLGPSIFCRVMGKARPLREEMDGKVVYFPPDSAFFNFDAILYKVFSLFVPSIWRVNNYVSPRKRYK